VPLGASGTIDHFVVGPPGVFVLNTKHLRQGKVWVAEGSFVVNGQTTNYLPSSRAEGQRAAALLSTACGFEVAVVAVIVVIAANLAVKSQPPDVHVVGRTKIVTWLQGLPATLDGDEIEAIYDQARRDSTWPTSAALAP